MRTRKLIGACFPALLLSAGCDSTDPVGPVVPLASIAIPIEAGSGGVVGVISGVRIFAGYAADFRPTVLFVDSLVLAHEDTGRYVVLTRGSPEFDAAEALLTNGIDDDMIIGLVSGSTGTGGGASSAGPESHRYENCIDGSLPPDLQGLHIERITLEIDVATVVSPGSDPRGDGNWTDYNIVGRIVFEGRP